jgi:hypothetical protein
VGLPNPPSPSISNVSPHSTHVLLRNRVNPFEASKSKSECVLDSGACRHFFSDISLFTSLDINKKERFQMASSHLVTTEGTGTVLLKVGDQKIKLSNVAYYPKATTNLISLSYLEDHHGLFFNAKKRQLQSPTKVVCIPFKRSLSSFVLCVSSLCVSGGTHTRMSGGDAKRSGGASSVSGGASSLSGGAYALSGGASSTASTARLPVSGGVPTAVRAAQAAASPAAEKPSYCQVLRQ